MPSHSNFANPIQKNLKYHNFDIKFINSSPDNLKIPLVHLVYHWFRKLFLADSTYKTKYKQNLKSQIISQEINESISHYKPDYTLVIRPDLFSLEHLDDLKAQNSQNFIGYQWNGLSRFPNTFLSINKFNRFFIFDNIDLLNPKYKNYKLMGTTNFYFDMYYPKATTHQGTIAYFVGLHFDERTFSLNLCAQELIKLGVKLDFNIRLRRNEQNAPSQYQCNNIKFITRDIEFDENINHINNADILVDVVNPIHNGLSFRTFEALYYEKKLITNNKTVKDYDFYHPNNILIWNGQNLSELADFLTRPFITVNTEIREKYSFNNWIKNILDISPNQTIELPNSHIAR